MNTRLLPILFFQGLLMSGAALAAPVTLFQDTFDTETLITSSLYSLDYIGFAQWDVTANTVDITVLPNGFIASPGGYGAGQAADRVVVDLNGSQFKPGTIETKQALTFLAGVTYTLSYAFGNARSETNSALVQIPGLVSETRTQTGTTGFTNHVTTFTPTVSTTAKLRFVSLGGNDQDGLLLDNVSITSNAVSVPALPWFGALLLALGLAFIGLMAIRNRTPG